jgi:hypothetical protein
MTRSPSCVLCGAESSDVETGLIRWRTGEPFSSAPRCRDRDGCHGRVLSLGDEWLVDDGRPALPPKAAPRPGPTLSDEEFAAAAGIAATPAKEENTWFD